jgi:hypothetical protein
MAQVDPWTKAADCERAIRIRLDPLHRVLDCAAQTSGFLSDDALAQSNTSAVSTRLDRDARG